MERIGGLWGGKNRSNFIPQITQPKYPDASLPFLGPLLLNNTSQGPKKRISRCHGPSSWDEKFSSLHVVNLSGECYQQTCKQTVVNVRSQSIWYVFSDQYVLSEIY